METKLWAFISILAVGSLITSRMQYGPSSPPTEDLGSVETVSPRKNSNVLHPQTQITAQGGSVIVEGAVILAKGAKVQVRQEASSDGQDVVEQLCTTNSREWFRIVSR